MMARSGVFLSGISFLALSLLPQFSWAQSAVNLGSLSPDFPESSASHISPDGTVVIGQAETLNGQEGFYWTSAGGKTALGDLNGGGFYSMPYAVSGNGQVVVGQSRSANGEEAFRWTQSGGMIGLGDLAGGDYYSVAYAANQDGSVIVGTSSVGTGGAREAFRWTQGGGMVGLGNLGGTTNFSTAHGISADGTIIVGQSDGVNGQEAFRWTQSGNMVGLGDLTGGSFFSSAKAISANGQVIVGQSESSGGFEAFRWTQANGMIGLGDLQGGDYYSAATAVNADGSAIVGVSRVAEGDVAFHWTEKNGMQSIRDILAYIGVDMDGWMLSSAQGVTEDGTVVVGNGSYNGTNIGYIANLATGGVTTPHALNASLQTIQQTGQQAAVVARSYAPGGLFLAQNMNQIAVPVSSASSNDVQSFANFAPSAGGAAPSRLSAFLLGSIGVGHNNTSGNYQLNGTLGVSAELSRDWMVGAGVIAGQTRSDLDFNGDSRLDASGGMVLASYVPYQSPLRIFGTAFGTHLSLDNKRGYLNGAGLDYSRGQTNGYTYGTAIRIGVEQRMAQYPVSYMPFVEGRYSKTMLDGYAETGGAFAAGFSSQEDDYLASRLGVEFRQAIRDDLTLLFRPAWGHRFSGEGSGLSATTNGLTVGYAGDPGDSNWAEAAIGGSYQASERVTLNTELTGRTGTTSEPVASLTVGAFIKF